MTIAYDRTGLEQRPVRWDMRQVITVTTAMGFVGVIGSFGMLPIGHGLAQTGRVADTDLRLPQDGSGWSPGAICGAHQGPFLETALVRPHHGLVGGYHQVGAPCWPPTALGSSCPSPGRKPS
ncbi:MAG: hypothetical protein ACP5SG_05360 [Dissulfurimicrobium sp.]|uniref:hypothetical protein n=1 Tax=Dissulfurimicrobium TaxID=1769732 RepID=UPI002ED0A55B